MLGVSVSVSGDTPVIGAYGADIGGNEAQGAAYVFALQTFRVHLPLVLRDF